MYDVWVPKTNILKNHKNQDLDKRLTCQIFSYHAFESNKISTMTFLKIQNP